MRRLKTLSRSEYFISDLAAVLLGIFLCALLLLTAKYSVAMSDEGYYYTVAHRLTLGEHMIADEWNLAQLVHLFNLLPNILYMKRTGGTEGLILFMRYLFIAINTVFYGFVYVKLRRWKLWGATAAFLFAAVIQQTLLTIAYFTSAPMAVLAVWLILAADEKQKSAPKLLFTGLVMACGILIEPFLIVIFLLWFVLTVIREYKTAKGSPLQDGYSFILNKRTFTWVTLGAVAMFIPYMLYLFLSGSFEGVGAAIPYLSSGAEYNKENLLDFEKFVFAADLYGPVFMAGGVLAVLAAAALRLKKNPDLRLRRLVLLAAGVVLAGSYVHAGLRLLNAAEMRPWVSFVQYNNLMLLLVSPVFWLLTQKKEPRLFTLWLIGVLYSVLVDISSTVILASGGALIRVACVLQLSVLLPELTAAPAPEKKKNKKTRQTPVKKPMLFLTALALCGAVTLAWNGAYLAAATVYKPVEKMFLHVKGPLTSEIERGPFKGLVTDAEIAGIYDDTLKDLDEVKALAGGRPVTVLELAPFTYLYMNLPYGAYSSWYEFDEPARLAAYWGLRPAQQPAVIYVPYYGKNLFNRYSDEYLTEKLSGLRQFADGPVTEGRAGYILRVEKLRTSETDAWTDVRSR